MTKRETICNILEQMEVHLRTDLLKKDGHVQEEKLWENTFIRQQIEKRKRDGFFSIEDHIRAMVYAMLSSAASWDRIAKETDPETKCLRLVDEVFYYYDTERLLQCVPDQLCGAVKEIRCGSTSTLKQMKALLSVNIPKLLKLEEENGTIDTYYQKFIEKDSSLKMLIKALSDPKSKDKMKQMDVALICEYLRNVGYDIPKPDRHICRILGSKYLAFSKKEQVPPFEAFDIVMELAEKTGKSAAWVDYILWSYCAKGYGEVCTIKSPKCGICEAEKYCGAKEKRCIV